MKKKIALITIVILTSTLNLYSQILTNTTWSVYDTTNTFFVYFHFSEDTLSFSEDNMSYTNISTYQESGNNFSIIDLPSGGCPVTDTGSYTFLINNDTLNFTLISDSCDSRILTLTTFHWVSFHVGIQNTNMSPMVEIYPNPASDKISIKSKNNLQESTYSIFDQYGKQLLFGKISGEITTVDIRQLTKGLYFLQIGEKRKQTVKILKK